MHAFIGELPLVSIVVRLSCFTNYALSQNLKKKIPYYFAKTKHIVIHNDNYFLTILC